MNNNHGKIFSYLETKIRENYIDLFGSTNNENYKLELGRKFLQDELKNAKKISIKTYKGEETGKFGRILGDVFVDGKSVNLKLLSI